MSTRYSYLVARDGFYSLVRSHEPDNAALAMSMMETLRDRLITAGEELPVAKDDYAAKMARDAQRMFERENDKKNAELARKIAEREEKK